jgi:hypothetical protein
MNSLFVMYIRFLKLAIKFYYTEIAGYSVGRVKGPFFSKHSLTESGSRPTAWMSLTRSQYLAESIDIGANWLKSESSLSLIGSKQFIDPVSHRET